MNRRSFLAIVGLLALVAAYPCAGEIQLDVNEELRRAERLRQAETERRAGSRVNLDSEQDLGLIQRGIAPERRIPGARYRVAVFTFEDPDDIGIGDAIASLIGRHIVLESGVSSIGVLRYGGSLAPSQEQPLSYFDKVEALSQAQDVTLAVWGMVRYLADEVSIDTFVQLPPRVIDSDFSWSLQLPPAMGGGQLVARLRPARIVVQRLVLPRQAVEEISETAQALDELRAEPDESSAIVARLPKGVVYWFTNRRDGWVEVATESYKGWVPVPAECGAGCAQLFDAARFSAGLLRFIDSRTVPQELESLEPETRAVIAQLAILDQIDTVQPGRFEASVLRPLEQWTELAQGSPSLPAGAAFTNIRSIAQVATSLHAATPPGSDSFESRFNSVEISKGRVHDLAYELAEASIEDPLNVDILHNLAVLFRYVGDSKRSALAEQLAQKARQ